MCHFSINPQRPEHSIEIVEPLSSALPPSGTFHTSNMQQRTPSFDAPNSLSRLVNGAPPSEDSVHPHQESGLVEADFSSLASQETLIPRKEV